MDSFKITPNPKVNNPECGSNPDDGADALVLLLYQFHYLAGGMTNPNDLGFPPAQKAPYLIQQVFAQVCQTQNLDNGNGDPAQVPAIQVIPQAATMDNMVKHIYIHENRRHRNAQVAEDVAKIGLPPLGRHAQEEKATDSNNQHNNIANQLIIQ